MKNKAITPEQVKNLLNDNMTILFGGFMGVGTAPKLVSLIIESGIKNLTLIASDSGTPDVGLGPLIATGQVKKLIASHIGTNPETGRRMMSGELDVELNPQGTLAERIRCGGAGLGGFLTPTGVGTIVEKGKQKIELDGRSYLLERPLRADLACVQAEKADSYGNLTYQLSARNFNPLIALAADIVIAECNEIVPVGSIAPDAVITPGAIITHLLVGGQA